MEIILIISAIACFVVLFAVAPRFALFLLCLPFIGFALLTLKLIVGEH